MLFGWSRTKEKAFTLLELIVVIVVLGVLAAIAVPTFQKVIERSSDEATLTELRAMAREAQALEAFDQNGWDDTDVTTAASDTSAVAPGVYAASLKATRDVGKDPIAGEVTYVIDGAGLALSKLSDTGRVCVVGANYSKVERGSCGPSEATATDSTLGARLSDPNAETFPSGTETVGVRAPSASTSYASLVAASSPAYWWRFEEASLPVLDSSGNALHAPYTIGSPVPGASSTLGAGRHAMSLNGSSGFSPVANNNADLPAGTPRIRDTFTMEMWVKPTGTTPLGSETRTGTTGTGSHRHLLWPDNDGSSTNYGVGLAVGTNGVAVYEHAANHMPSTLVWAGNLSSTSWSHLVVVYSGKHAKLYVNGVLVDTGLTSSRTGSPLAPVRVLPPYGGYSGLVDEMALYPAALSPDTIAAHHSAG